MSEWYSVEERLPKPGRIVNFYDGQQVYEGFALENGDWYFAFVNPEESTPWNGVSHWRDRVMPPDTAADAGSRELLDKVYDWLLSTTTEDDDIVNLDAICPMCYMTTPGSFYSVDPEHHWDDCPWPAVITERARALEAGE